MNTKLAMYGGEPSVPADQRNVAWPVITSSDQQAVLRVLASGKFTSSSKDEQEVRGLEQEWAGFVGTRYSVAVNSGTAALAVALSALDVQPGDEVIVPALSYVASGLAALHQLAIPVFVDVDPYTFNIDVRQIEAKITPRTRAIMPVHLHGLPADMDEIRLIAQKYNLVIVEDAAQAQGALYKGQMVGTLSDIGAFSLNVEKNIPTCGEGGLLTTDDPELYARCKMLRQMGEEIESDVPRAYVSYALGWNYKLSSIQAAFTRSQLQRYAEDQAARERNIQALLGKLSALPGVIVPTTPPDRTHVWHILRFRFDPEAAGLEGVTPGRFRQALRRALSAEGVQVSQYQLTPLPGQPVFTEQQGFGQGYPWMIPGTLPQSYDIEEYPNTLAIIEDSLCLRRVHLNPGSGRLLELYADAFYKVWENLDRIGRIAQSMAYEAPWETVRKRRQDSAERVAK
jgi:perosamine synthetase